MVKSCFRKLVFTSFGIPEARDTLVLVVICNFFLIEM